MKSYRNLILVFIAMMVSLPSPVAQELEYVITGLTFEGTRFSKPLFKIKFESFPQNLPQLYASLFEEQSGQKQFEYFIQNEDGVFESLGVFPELFYDPYEDVMIAIENLGEGIYERHFYQFEDGRLYNKDNSSSP